MRRSKAPPLGRNFVANPLPSPTPIPYRGGGWGVTLIYSCIYFTSIIGLRRSTQRHRSSKVGTYMYIVDLRKSTHRSSKVDTSIIDLRRSTHRSSKIEGGNIAPTTQHRADIPTIRHRILSTTAHRNYYIQDSARYIRTVYNYNIYWRAERPPLSAELSEFSLYLYIYTVEPPLTDALNNGHLLLSGQRRCTDHHCH